MATEVEVKLAFPAEARRAVERHPLLVAHKRGRATHRELYSVYYDTPDERLRKARMALRVRRDGNRWVQTLKSAGSSAGGFSEREETDWAIERPALDLTALPGTALDALRPRIDPAALKPVFATRFLRTAFEIELDGGTVAEVAIDTGLIDRPRASRTAEISEIEFELRSGDPAALLDIAIRLAADLPLDANVRSKAERGYALSRRPAPATPAKAGPLVLARDATLATAAGGVLAAALAQMQANERGVRVGRDPDYLHHFRVGLRRLRAALAVFAPAFPEAALEETREALRWLARVLGPARDWDVWCGTTLPDLRASLGARVPFDALERASRIERRRAQAIARAAVASSRYTQCVLAVARLAALARAQEAAAAAPVLARDHCEAVLERRCRRMFKRKSVPGAPAERHELRIAGKKLRYGIEFALPLYGKRDANRAAAFAARLAGLQEVLGRLNDLATAARLIDALAARHPALDPLALAGVRGWIAGAAHASGATLDGQYDALRRARP